MPARSVLAVLASISLAACGSEESGKQPAGAGGGAQHGGSSGAAGSADAGLDGAARSDAGSAGNVNAGMISSCDEHPLRALRILSASLAASPPRFEQIAELTDSEAGAVVHLTTEGVPGLRWANGSLLELGYAGFWDIQLDGSAQWLETPPGIVNGAIAGDLDGDGDQDLLVADTRLEMVEKDGVLMPASVAHLLTWERTASGLVRRSEVLNTGPFVGMPFALADFDHDGLLDILAYQDGLPLGMLNRGAFRFERKVLGGSAQRYAGHGNSQAIALFAGDRDGDEAPDLVAVMGSSLGADSIAILNDGKGSFMAPGPAMRDDPPIGGLAIGDVTGDGIADVIAATHQKELGELRLTASITPTMFASSVQIASDPVGVRLADVDEDGRLDIVTTIERRAIAVTGRDRVFETRDLHLPLPSDTLDFALDPGDGSKPARLFVSQRICGP